MLQYKAKELKVLFLKTNKIKPKQNQFQTNTKTQTALILKPNLDIGNSEWENKGWGEKYNKDNKE